MSKNNFSGVCVGGPRDGETIDWDSPNMDIPKNTKTRVGRADKGAVPSRLVDQVVSYRYIELTANVPGIWIPSGQSIGETVEKLIQYYQRGVQ